MRKRDFLVQLHLHTSESSRCGASGGAEMARACKRAGYSLIVITDHFFNANTNCPRRTPWPDKVRHLFSGYRAAKAAGDRIGLTVLMGWETYTDGPEYLSYGLGEEFLLDQPNIAELPGPEYLELVRSAGGFVSHAHPYREAFYIPEFTPDHEHVDAFEVYNANHEPRFNAPALRVAQRYGLIQLAGSDAHHVDEVGGGAMRLPYPAHDMHELIHALRTGKCEVIEKL